MTGDVDPGDFIKVRPGMKMLDYGCGGGSYLKHFFDRGINVVGAEISPEIVEACRRRGLPVTQVCDFNRVPFENEEFDVVYLMQVFEHLREPELVLRELCRVTRPGGSIYIAVPNFKSWWKRLFGRNWVSGWFAPFHLYFYDAHSLGMLARKCGASLVRSWTRTPESWFRLNLRANFTRSAALDAGKSSLESVAVRASVGFLLRTAEVFVSQKDCLIVEIRVAN